MNKRGKILNRCPKSNQDFLLRSRIISPPLGNILVKSFLGVKKPEILLLLIHNDAFRCVEVTKLDIVQDESPDPGDLA